jgi:hypothetical protein
MPYTQELKIGAVYQSRMEPKIRRRVMSVRHGCVKYVLMGVREGRPSICDLTEEIFRDLTAREIAPEEMN